MAKNILKNTVYYSIGEIIPRILSLLILPVLTTYLTAYEYGINSYTTAVMAFMFVLASLSLNTFILSKYFSKDSEKERKELIGSVFLFILLFNAALCIAQIILFPLAISFFGIEIPFLPFFLLAILNNFFDVISIIPLVLFRVKEDARGFLIISLSRTILQYILVVVFVVFLDKGLEGSYYGRLLANIPFVFVYIYYINKYGILRLNAAIIKQALRFSLPLLPGGLSYLLITMSDRIILERFISLDQLGIYSIAVTLALALNVVIQALYKTFEPILFKEFQNKNFGNTNLKLYKIFLLCLFICAFGTAIFSKEIFYIATSGEFRQGYKVVPLLIIPVIISGVNTYLEVLMIAAGKQNKVSLVTIGSGLISISFNFLLIPSFGYWGAITASCLSFIIANIICQFHTDIKRRYNFAQVFLVSLIALVPYSYDQFTFVNKFFIGIFFKIFLIFMFSILAIFLLDVELNKLKNIKKDF